MTRILQRLLGRLPIGWLQLTHNPMRFAAALIGVGFVMAFISGVFVVRYLLDYVSRHGFKLFGWWRLIVGSVGLAALLVWG